MTRHLILAATAALTLGACGSSDNNNSGSSGNRDDKAFDGALKFARCMRDHGVDVPDPQRSAGGKISLRVGGPGKQGNGPRPDSPAFQTAQKACGKYMNIGGGPPADAATRAKAQDAFVSYASCMRSKGIKMQDPQTGPNGGGILMRADKGDTNPESPAFKAADKVCHHFLADLEKQFQSQQGKAG